MEKIKIIFLGDVSFSGQNATTPHFVDSELSDILKSADAVICNFESTFTSEDKPGLFQSPVSKAGLLKEAGITHAIVANNHIYDYGYEGLESTISVLKSAGIEPLGLKRLEGEDQQVTSVEIKGIHVGLLCSGWTRVGQNPNSPNIYREYHEGEIAASVRELNTRFDHLLVVCHRGKMFVEYPAPSDKKAFQGYLKLGARAVIAHHPHVAQGISFTNNKLIAYSLGNFFFDSTEGHVQSSFSEEKQNLGAMLSLELSKDKLLGHKITPVYKSGLKTTLLEPHKSDSFRKHLNRISNRSSNSFANFVFFNLHFIRFVVPHFIKVKLYHLFK